ncbi:hypothetical protein [Calothrix sp. NIES-2098]|uniref:hypothetical protein n=1 Tax=Calothrix sp. NIES-2098 TaxID=1954171 RepID=UPI000B610FB0|nr:hypothetical protein NIES2098_43500 [Calothrix sp. NIES-2098]
MSIKYHLGYYCLPIDYYQLIDKFLESSGDNEKRIITEYLCDWIDCNREYYLDLAKKDAQSRNISFSEWGKIVVDRGMKALTSYKQPLVELHISPLPPTLSDRYLLKRSITYITISKQNCALLDCAIHYDNDTKVSWISRVINKYIEDKALGYIAQIEADDLATWNDTEKHRHDLYYLDRDDLYNGKYTLNEIADEVVEYFKFDYLYSEEKILTGKDEINHKATRLPERNERNYESFDDIEIEITDEEIEKYRIECFKRKFKTIKLLDRRTLEYLKKAEEFLIKKQSQFSGNRKIYECLTVLKILISKLDSFN